MADALADIAAKAEAGLARLTVLHQEAYALRTLYEGILADLAPYPGLARLASRACEKVGGVYYDAAYAKHDASALTRDLARAAPAEE